MLKTQEGTSLGDRARMHAKCRSFDLPANCRDVNPTDVGTPDQLNHFWFTLGDLPHIFLSKEDIKQLTSFVSCEFWTTNANWTLVPVQFGSLTKRENTSVLGQSKGSASVPIQVLFKPSHLWPGGKGGGGVFYNKDCDDEDDMCLTPQGRPTRTAKKHCG